MDPLSAIGLVSSVMTFIDFGYEVISAAREVRSSATGTTAANNHMEFLNTRMQAVATDLAAAKSNQGSMSADARRLTELADKCLELSNDLKRLLDKLRANDSNSKRQVLSAIVHNVTKKDQKKDLEARLDQCRQLLHLQLSHATRLESLSRLSEIAQTGKCHARELESLNHQLAGLKDAVAGLNAQSKLLDEARTVLELSDLAISKVLQNKILEALRFGKMGSRFDSIEEAHTETFKWLLEDENSSSTSITTATKGDPWFAGIRKNLEEVRPLRHGIRKDFTNWLLHGNGIFHISGKPGAGKSTLMKYLAESEEVKTHLTTWAQKSELVFASFFFWRHGTGFQKSLQGLLRSLLYSVLYQHPDLARIVFPTQWEAASTSSTKKLHFSLSDIQKAFSNLTTTPEVYSKHKFAFFIDGLDEFEGHDDTLIKTLFEWAHSGSENIKICVSSRELPIFQQRFSKSLKFRLHEVTYHDIFLVVYDTLRSNEEIQTMYKPQDAAYLGKMLVRRAEGVFLWVSLALRLVERGLVLEESIGELERSIDVLPSELEQLFRVIFDSIKTERDLVKRRKAMRILSLAVDELKVRRFKDRLFLTHLSFMDDYDRNQDFASHMRGNVDATARDSRLSRCRKQLNGGCRGLVTIRSHADVVVRKESVELAHRSLIEFFQLSDVQACIQEHSQGFDKLHFYSQSLIAEMKVWPPSQDYDELKTFSPQESNPESRIPAKSELLYGESWLVHDLQRLISLYYYAQDQDISTLVPAIYQLRKLLEADAKSTWEFQIAYIFVWDFGAGYSTKSFQHKHVPCCLAACVILTALQFGLYEVWSKHTLDKNLRETILHLVTSSLTNYRLGLDIQPRSFERTFDRLLRTLATCLADGTSANSLMPVHENFVNVSVWHNLVWDCIMTAGVRLDAVNHLQSAAPIWLLFLLHGAVRDFTLSFEQSYNFSAKGRRGKLFLVTGHWGPDKFQVHSPIFIDGGEVEDDREDSGDGNILELARRHNWSVSLKELLYFWFPRYEDSFRKIYDLYESSVDVPMERLSDLRQELGLDPECWQTQMRKDPRPLLQYRLSGTTRILYHPVYESGDE